MIIIIGMTSMLTAGAAAGCGNDSAGGDEGNVVATTGILASIGERVAGGQAEITQLIPDGADPHDFALSADDRLELEEADLVLANGASLEEGIPLDETDAAVFELAEHAGTLREGDPHVWMDPDRVAEALPALAEALGEADPSNAEAYERNAAAYADELRELDAEVSAAIDSIPRANRKLVTSHDALGYFADRYGLEVVASPFGPLGAGGEPSAEALQETIDSIEATGVPAIFAQEEDDPSVMQRIAEESGVELVDGLLVESPGAAGTYEAMLETDAELIAGALGGR
jgi:ABC-type Zn uptake system ZnuABC Zn-binding protein ZnuA